MSIVSLEAVGAVADELGIDAEGVAPMVASEVELRMRHLVQDMARFMIHGKRQKLTTTDTQHALKLHGYDGIYGFGCADPMIFKRIESKGQDIYFLQEKDVDIAELAESMEALPKVPTKPTFSIHWLSIQGVQPTVVENPTKKRNRAKNQSSLNGQSLMEGKKARRESDKHATGENARISVTPVAKHVLSQELQLYFDKVVSAIQSSILNPGATQSVYASLSCDPGLHQLLPYFTKLVSETVNNNLRNCPLLTSMMRLTRCLVVNPYLNLELYLHQLMPPIATCLVGKRLCSSPFEDHWSLRNLAASLLKFVCVKYQDAYPDLQPRIAKTLHSAILDLKKPLTTQYGAIVGITMLGPLTVEQILLPVMTPIVAKLETALLSAKQPVKRMEAHHCYCAFQVAIGEYLLNLSKTKVRPNKQTIDMISQVGDAFGESLVPYIERCMAIDKSSVQAQVVDCFL